MQVTETLSEGLKRGFTVVVPAAEIESKRVARLAQLGKTVSIPGFRPGKVPANVLRQRYGAAVQAEVVEDAVGDATEKLLEDRGLRAALQPKIDLVSAADADEIEFKVELEVLPEITMPDFGQIELTRLKATPDAATVEKAMGEIAARQSELSVVEESRGAEKSEILTVDFVGKIDGEAFQGGTATGIDLEVAGSGFIPGFTEQVEGMKVGESRDIKVTFPQDYPAKELAGKEATFEITAQKLSKKVAASINEDFAKKLGFENLDKLREALSEQLQREYDNLSRINIKRQLLDALAERTSFEAPASVVEREFDGIWQRVDADLKAGRLDDEDKGKDEGTLKAEYRTIAERRVKLGLLLSEIGRANRIQVTPDELIQAMRAEAARYPGQEAQVIEFFRKNRQATDRLHGPILEEKVVDYVLDLAKVSEKEATPEQLTEEPQSKAA